MGALIWIRLRRIAASAADPFMPLLTAIIALAVALLGRCTSNGASSSGLEDFTYVVASLAILFWIWSTYSGYVRRSYDPTWVLRYQDMWDSQDGYKRRSDAAEKLRLHRPDLNPDVDSELLKNVDDALDLLTDIGFYVAGDQISPEAAHHHFYYWVRGYWSAAGNYIRARQKADHRQWLSINFLYNVTSAVDAARPAWDQTASSVIAGPAVLAFLDEEADLHEKLHTRL
jgi:hypothetical protein